MRGDVLVSPWSWAAQDYVGLVISITVTFDDVTRALTGAATLHRDTGCQYGSVVIGVPGGVATKVITAPADGKRDRSVSAATLASQGLSTIEDVLALQITAQP